MNRIQQHATRGRGLPKSSTAGAAVAAAVAFSVAAAGAGLLSAEEPKGAKGSSSPAATPAPKTDAPPSPAAKPDSKPAPKPAGKDKKAKTDLLSGTLVPVDKEVDLAAESVKYRLVAKRRFGDLPTDARQAFTRKSPTEAEILIKGSPGYPKQCKTRIPVAVTPENSRWLSSNFHLESDEEALKALAKKALEGETDALAAGRKLETFVCDWISDKNLKVAFATAAQTAKSRMGDCTEHAVLLAGLGRAAGLPSRVVAGLVYADQFVGNRQIFAYHMWAEFEIDGEWYPFDAALLPRGGYGPGHIALVKDDLNGANCELQLSLGIIQLLGNISVEVLEQKKAPAPK